ncbi:uncharacterized protein LOC132192705 [Neocloeon triangulifer]|uniref:uncharacterized protein LOC132192705 n=1 Tax=Neocloeon triangulifer TaxID=2078957 RepID=UPI00286F3629|nr:uncharacterized protein LOC132192705 [Neocloeon triangulifer]
MLPEMGKRVHLLVLIAVALITYETLAVKTRGNTRLKNHNSRSAKRQTIITCCGATPCSETASKRLTSSSTQNKSNSTFSTTTSPIPTSEETEMSGTETITEKVTLEAETTSEEPASETSLESTSTTSTTSTSTTTTSTTTTTPTSTSTTTRPPTKEELLLGTCETTFEKDPILFTKDGIIKDPESQGFWVQSCGQQFLFGKSLATWRENFIKCYKIGMEPLTFESAAKLECFSKLVSTWKYSSNYWTSSLRVNESEFSWCTKNGSFAVDRAKLPWAAGQPQNVNNSENCVHLNIEKSNATFSFTDRMCTDQLIFGCQGPPTPAPPCSMPTCPNITCTKNTALYTTSGSSQYLTLPSSHGSWFTYNGRSFLFSTINKTETYTGAMQACCGIGMTLISLEYDYKYKSLIAAIKDNSNLSDYYWTSGSDQGCESNFGYCTAKRSLRQEAIWASGQPDNADGNESAVVVFVNQNNAQLYDFNEESKFRYICEARDTSKSKSGGTAVRDECAAIYNVSQAEIDTLLNPSVPKDLRMKCFIKCLGENSNLMVNGKFLENEVFAILEKMAAGNVSELQNNMGVMNDCGTSSAGMDECDKASQMIKCSSEKAPEVLNGIVSAMDQSMPIAPAPLPPQAVCSYGPFPCTVAPSLAQEVANCTGNCSISDGYVQNLCGTKYLFVAAVMYNSQAYDNCCRHGMKLASIESVNEINCIAGANTPTIGSWHWVAASKVNGTTPRWCTSNVPYSTEGFSGAYDTQNIPSDNAYVLTPNSKAFSVTSDTQRYVLCKAL